MRIEISLRVSQVYKLKRKVQRPEKYLCQHYAASLATILVPHLSKKNQSPHSYFYDVPFTALLRNYYQKKSMDSKKSYYYRGC